MAKLNSIKNNLTTTCDQSKDVVYPSKGKGGVMGPSFSEPSGAGLGLRSGQPPKYLRTRDAVALVPVRVEGGLIRPSGSGLGSSALGSQTPKFLRTWDGGATV